MDDSRVTAENPKCRTMHIRCMGIPKAIVIGRDSTFGVYVLGLVEGGRKGPSRKEIDLPPRFINLPSHQRQHDQSGNDINQSTPLFICESLQRRDYQPNGGRGKTDERLFVFALCFKKLAPGIRPALITFRNF